MKLFQPLMIVMLAAGSQVAANEPVTTDNTATARSAQPLADGNSAFNQLDVDRDGWLTSQEVEADVSEEIDFATADRDGDERLSSDEWTRRNEPVDGQ